MFDTFEYWTCDPLITFLVVLLARPSRHYLLNQLNFSSKILLYGKFQLLKVNIVKAFHRNDFKFSTAIALVQFFLKNNVIINIIMSINEMEYLKHCNLIPFEDIYRKFLVESFFIMLYHIALKLKIAFFSFF